MQTLAQFRHFDPQLFLTVDLFCGTFRTRLICPLTGHKTGIRPMVTTFVSLPVADRLRDSGLELAPNTFSCISSPNFPLLGVNGYTVSLPEGGSVEEVLAQHGFTRICLGFLGNNKEAPAFTELYAPELETAFVVSDRAEAPLEYGSPTLMKRLEGLFTELSHLTGREFVVDIRSSEVAVPCARTDGKIRVLIGALPPGPMSESELAKMPRRNVSQEMLLTLFDRPVMGLGTVVTGDHELATAQIVGDDIYLLVRMDVHAAEFSFDGLFGAIRSSLNYAWEAYLKQEPTDREALSDTQSLAAVMETWSDSFRIKAEQLIQAAEQRVKDAEREYTEALGEWKGAQLAWRVVPEFQKTLKLGHEETLAAWQQVLEHPLTDRIEEIELGFHLMTKEVVLEHEGKAYRLGTFGIRLDLEGHFTVWSPNPTHPENEPHPHISRDGTVCYGNVTLAIRERITVKRDYPGAMLMVLDWLAYGYEPASTLHPIEEWPTKETT